MASKGLTYEELMELAKQHYNDGGDQTFECWDKQFYNMYIEMFGSITKSKALAMFKRDKARYEDIKATAW